MRGSEPGIDEWGDEHPNAWAQGGSDRRAGAETGEQEWFGHVGGA